MGALASGVVHDQSGSGDNLRPDGPGLEAGVAGAITGEETDTAIGFDGADARMFASNSRALDFIGSAFTVHVGEDRIPATAPITTSSRTRGGSGTCVVDTCSTSFPSSSSVAFEWDSDEGRFGTGTDVPLPSGFNHFAGVYEAGALRYYANGVQLDVVQTEGSLMSRTSRFTGDGRSGGFGVRGSDRRGRGLPESADDRGPRPPFRGRSRERSMKYRVALVLPVLVACISRQPPPPVYVPPIALAVEAHLARR